MMGLFDGLPRAGEDRAVIYILGPGFGESQVVQFPDRRTAVIDCCRQGDVCLTKELLDWLEVDGIDLLVITHPDLDHIDGLDQLLEHHKPLRAWRYPGYADLGEWVARWISDRPNGDRRLQSLRTALTAFEAATLDIEASPVCYGFREWPAPHEPGRIACLAPAAADLRRAVQPFGRLIQFGRDDRPRIDNDLLDYLTGKSSQLDRHGNRLSLALAVRWGDHRTLLCGDVENVAHPRRGWKGILAALDDDGRSHEITDLSVVKAAHHGSRRSWSDGLWDLAAQTRKVPVLVMTPFNRGRNPPPHQEVLRKAKRCATVVSLTSDSESTRALRGAEQWVRGVGVRTAGGAPCVAIDLPAHGLPTVHVCGAAGAWSVDAVMQTRAHF